MKTKSLLLAIMLIGLGAFCSCGGLAEEDAKILIKAKIKKCANITEIDGDYYVAVDSCYNIHIFDENGAAIN